MPAARIFRYAGSVNDRRRTVLIVEDDHQLRALYSTELRLAGFEVRESGDGLRALHELDYEPTPDCIVLDLMLPVLSGHAVKHELAASAEMHDIPVIVITGSDANLDRFGARAVLRKPFLAADLVEAVERCTRSDDEPKLPSERREW